MNVEDPLHEYGRWCKPVLEDGETGKQYENALEVMDLLNEFNDENKQLKQQMRRLYNYFTDWFEGRIPPSDFSEMWDFVTEDEKWD